MLKRLLLVLVIAGAVFGGVFWLKTQQIQQGPGGQGGGPPPATVAVTEVREEQWHPKLLAVGTLTAYQGIFVTNEVAGTVREILFQSGQAVGEGDILFRLDDSVDRAELRGLVAERDLAVIKYNRLAKLLKDRSISQADVDEAKANLDNAEAQVASKQAVIAKKTIRAPFSGLLGIRTVDIGEFLAPGSKVVPLEALEPIFADFALPERHLRVLGAGQSVSVRVAAYPEGIFEGRVEAINPGVDVATRSVQVRAVLSNSEHKLRPGMFADIQVVLPDKNRVLTIPRLAVTFNPYGDAVFVVTEKNGKKVVERRQITTGEVQSGSVEVLEGLAVGETVVSAGHVKLHNGQEILIDSSVVPAQGAVLPGSKA